MDACEKKAHWMNQEPTPEKDTKSPSKSSNDAAAQKAEAASEAKAEELRAARPLPITFLDSRTQPGYTFSADLEIRL